MVLTSKLATNRHSLLSDHKLWAVGAHRHRVINALIRRIHGGNLAIERETSYGIAWTAAAIKLVIKMVHQNRGNVVKGNGVSSAAFSVCWDYTRSNPSLMTHMPQRWWLGNEVFSAKAVSRIPGGNPMSQHGCTLRHILWNFSMQCKVRFQGLEKLSKVNSIHDVA